MSKLIDIDFKEYGFIFLSEGLQSASLEDRYVKFREWIKIDQKTSSDNMVTVRVYRDNDKVIIYRGGDKENFLPPTILFNGRIPNIELFELIYNLVKY